MLINLSSHFKRAYSRLPESIKKNFKTNIQLFENNPYNPVLRTHKLHGKLQECFAFCLVSGYRVLFEFSDVHVINLLDIGSHDIYRKY